MKFTVANEQTIEAQYLSVILPVMFEEEQIPYDAPLRKGNVWAASIDLETGIIPGWPSGHALDLYLKVVDGGSYYLVDQECQVVAKLEEDYVPDSIPGEWGDYVDFEIDETGRVTNWNPLGEYSFSNFAVVEK